MAINQLDKTLQKLIIEWRPVFARQEDIEIRDLICEFSRLNSINPQKVDRLESLLIKMAKKPKLIKPVKKIKKAKKRK